MIANPEYKCKKCGEVFIDTSMRVTVFPNTDGETIRCDFSDLNIFIDYKKIPLIVVHTCFYHMLGIAELIGVNLED